MQRSQRPEELLSLARQHQRLRSVNRRRQSFPRQPGEPLLKALRMTILILNGFYRYKQFK